MAGAKKLILIGPGGKALILTPRECKKTFSLKEEGQFIKLDSLQRKTTGGNFSFFYGLPDMCPICGKPATNYKIYIGAYMEYKTENGLTADLSKINLSNDEKSGFWFDYTHERDFLVIPFCGAHDEIPVYYKSE
jgi:hypothetical protein